MRGHSFSVVSLNETMLLDDLSLASKYIHEGMESSQTPQFYFHYQLNLKLCILHNPEQGQEWGGEDSAHFNFQALFK